jgi:hypothetical protein
VVNNHLNRKTMNRLLRYIVTLALVLSACDPLEDIYEEMDEMETGYASSFERLLTSDDYADIAEIARESKDPGDSADADFIEGNEYFSNDVPASKYIPPFLSREYPALGQSSVANIGYDFYADYPEYLDELTGPEEYEVTDSNYLEVGVPQGRYKTFIGADNPDQFILDFLVAAIPGAVEEDVRLVLYKYTSIIVDPSVTRSMVDEDYQIIVDWVEANIDTSYIGDYGDSETYFGAGAYYQNFDARDGYWEDTAFASSQEAILYAIGDVWLPEKYPNATPEVEGKTVYYNITYETYDGTGHTYYVVFSCTAAGDPPVFELVDGPSEEYLSYSSTSTVDMGAYYKYDGSAWEAMEDVYYLSSADYDAMGDPGRYNNFSSSAPPENYIPQLLAMKYPYAQTDDKLAVGYKYFSGGKTLVRAGEYLFSVAWTSYEPVIAKQDQFIQNGTKWVFDPTVTFSISSADYQLIVDWVKANKGESYLDSYGTSEFYYGASAYYLNFDIRSGSFESADFDTWEEAVEAAIGKVLLPAKYPNAVTQVDGVDVYYVVKFATYSGSDGSWSMKFMVSKAGPDPEFTLVEGPLPD